MTDPTTTQPDDGAAIVLTNWEFVDKIPTTNEVVDLLMTLKPVHGVEFVEIADHVQGLPSNKKVKVQRTSEETGRTVEVEEYRSVVTLYVSVAGRMKMLNIAAEMNAWRVDFVPEPVTPTGIPGYLRFDDQRIVYREYVDIYDENDRLLGRRPGTAWVPGSGGKQAAGSNPYEKVETSARGRALGAWGFGIIPGSGIASLEEMQGVRENRQAMDANPEQPEGARPVQRGDLIDQVYVMVEEVRQARGKEQFQMFTEIDAFCRKTFGRGVAKETDETGAVVEIDPNMLKNGELQLLVNGLNQSLAAARSQAPAL